MLKVLSRICNSEDGQELVQFLTNLSTETYKQWKRSPSDLNDIFKGQMIAIDDLIQVLTTASEKLAKMNEPQEVKYEYTQNPAY